MSMAATASDKIAFSSGLRPAKNPATGKLIDNVDEARTILASAGVPLDFSGLPVQTDNVAARRLLAKASSWIDERGNLIDTPEKSPRCFGLPRFVMRRACRSCKFRQNCQAVMGARLTFGGKEEFKRLRTERPINWKDAAILAAVSAIMGWESQHEAIAVERSRRKARERKQRYYERNGIDPQARQKVREAERERIRRQREGLVVTAREEAPTIGVADKLRELAARDDLRRDPTLRRALTDQFSHLEPVWIARQVAEEMDIWPDDTGYLSELIRAYRLITGSEEHESTIRNRVRTGAEVLEELRERGAEI